MPLLRREFWSGEHTLMKRPILTLYEVRRAHRRHHRAVMFCVYYAHSWMLSGSLIIFWRTWKNIKVNNRRTTASQVDGYSNASDIATVFAKRFHQACLPIA